MDLIEYINRQREWSAGAFGHSPRTVGITSHIEKELKEIRASPYDLMEWVDVMILAFDGAWRAGYTAREIADALGHKQEVNFSRKWPPVRACDPDKPIEHIR